MIALILLNCLVVITVVVIHYEFLFHLTAVLPKIRVMHRFRIVIGVLVALVAHMIEVWVFAFAYYFMHNSEGWGHLEGSFNGSLMDYSYYSFTSYTTLGFGDITPIGDIRYLTAIESLTGLVLITWTASFLFLEMQRHWQPKE